MTNQKWVEDLADTVALLLAKASTQDIQKVEELGAKLVKSGVEFKGVVNTGKMSEPSENVALENQKTNQISR